jgi:hypothetical protein
MIYKRGSKGDVVKQIQIALHINPDGIFGPLTEQAVKEFQRKNGLVVDGIVGDKTLSLLLPKPQEETFITKGYINTHITRLANRPIKYIAIHYTAGSTSRKGTALSTRNVFLKRNASADFVVDDETIVQINPDLRNYYCWSVGDAKNKTTGGGNYLDEQMRETLGEYYEPFMYLKSINRQSAIQARLPYYLIIK